MEHLPHLIQIGEGFVKNIANTNDKAVKACSSSNKVND